MATPSQFFLINKDQFFEIKIELAIEWETHRAEMRGPQNGDSTGEFFLEGQA